jgi:feruloyl esterase
LLAAASAQQSPEAAAIQQTDWKENLRRAGASPGEVAKLEESIRQQLPESRAKWEESIRNSPQIQLGKMLARQRVQKQLADAESSPKAIFADVAPVCSIEDLRKVSLPNTIIESVAIDTSDGSCRVTAVVTHPPATDRVRVFIALPTKGWNGRFLGTGGGGFWGGGPENLAGHVRKGFAVGATDTGHEGGSGSFALNANGRLNWQEIRNNAYLGIHDMTVVAMELAKIFYGKAPAHAYFIGCSTGGRQGLSEAQRYPGDYDGIVSGCPAINWAKFVPALLWPQVVMLETGNIVPESKLNAATQAAIEAEQAPGSVPSEYLDDPRKCNFDPQALVGKDVEGSTFTQHDAVVIRRIWEGPRRIDGSFLWYGLQRGTNLAVLAGKVPHMVGVDYCKYYLMQNPLWNWANLTREEYELISDQSAEEFGAVLGTDNPDLANFRDRGGKLIIWHGWEDTTIPPEGSVQYFDRVQQKMGGAKTTESFMRLFMAPGVGHCSGGRGPQPIGLLNTVIQWVEEGKAPDRIAGAMFNETGVQIGIHQLLPYRKPDAISVNRN